MVNEKKRPPKTSIIELTTYEVIYGLCETLTSCIQTQFVPSLVTSTQTNNI